MLLPRMQMRYISLVEVWVYRRKEVIMTMIICRLFTFPHRLSHDRCALWFEGFDIALVERVDKRVGCSSCD